jgi:signal transduction histidine kinase
MDAPVFARTGEEFGTENLTNLVNEISGVLGLGKVSVLISEGLEEVPMIFSERALELILWELLQNAEKFHPSRSPHVEVLLSLYDEHTISLKVMDDGLTLSPDQLAHVWTPYYQGEKRFTGEVPGMGLGLSMIASLIWQVGGSCSISNREDGSGIVVELLLPASNTAGT